MTWKRSGGLFVLVAGVWLAGSQAVLAADAPRGEVSAKTIAAVEDLQARYPGARAFGAAGRIRSIYGRAMTTGDTPIASAERFRHAHARVFGAESADLRLGHHSTDGRQSQPVLYDRKTGQYGFEIVYYSQFRGGLPVFRGDLRVLVLNEPGFPVVLANSALRDLGEFTVDQALLSAPFDPATDAVTGMINFTAPEPVIWAGVEDMRVDPVLAYTFVGDNGRTDAEYKIWRFVCAAATGEVLHTEDMIQLLDVEGSVSAMATPGAKAAICTEEILFPYPWARVDIVGGETVYADGEGNFTIPNAGTDEVTVRSYVDGLYFTIDNWAGAEETLPLGVVPPGPVDFIHNEANTDDLVLAQTNIYVAGNDCRDWVLTYNPSFPGVSTETGVLTVVNRTDYVCPCNAWSDGGDGSINFCQPGDGCPNTAWQSVLNHEYGHHIIDFTGSGQGEYGEGMGDCIAILPVDDPHLGYGFFGNCNSGLRNADNDCQYLSSGCSTCGSEIHDCGNLLSGCVWSIRNELIVTEPDDYLDILSNIVVNSILLHSGSGINAQIAIDFLTLDDAPPLGDGIIGNGTPHYDEICAGFEAHSIECPELDLLIFTYPDGRPEIAAPNQPTTFRVDVSDVAATALPGTGRLHYSLDGGAYVAVFMNETSPNHYEAMLPAADCLSRFDWYVSAKETGQAMVTDPRDAPDTVYSTVVATGIEVFMADDFETDQGWTVVNSGGLNDGAWGRGVPVDCSRGDPPSDFDGSGQCYLTDNSAANFCNSDVDDGTTWLLSPTLDLSSGDARVDYALWYTNDNGADPNNDLFHVHVSNDDGANWTLVETFGPVTSGGWTEHAFSVGGFVTPTAQVKVRFEASDLNSGSVVEAGVDAFYVSTFLCAPVETCEDGIRNQGEELIDCGGPCAACECTSDEPCVDGLFCTGTEFCDAFGRCQAGTAPCSPQLCDEGTDTCADCQNDADCIDGLYCNGQETCDGLGACLPGTPVVCGDTVACTDDVCNEATDFCDYVPNDGLCANGSFCDGAETCDALLGCQSGSPIDCNDGVDCTVDSCNEGTDSCDNVPDDNLCDNGVFCDGAEICGLILGCQNGDDPCPPGELCRESDDQCVDCLQDADCDDADLCTGTEVCSGDGTCAHVLAADCDGNEVEDACDLTDCPPEDLACQDCNENGVPDGCDLAGGTSQDANSNGIPDECDAARPAPEPGGPACVAGNDCTGAWAGADCVSGTCYVPKNRYLSIDPTTNDNAVAYRVELTEAADYPTAVGRTWWVDEPQCYDYPDGNVVIPPPASCDGADRFGWVSNLTAAPVTRIWTEATVHVSDCGIAPAVVYEIRASADNGASLSAQPLEIGTAHHPDGDTQSWGDVTGGPAEGLPGQWLPPERTTNFGDVGNAIRTFENRAEGTGFPPRIWIDVEIDRVINLGDISFIVMAFEGRTYSDLDLPLIGTNPAECP